jgi:lipoprotein-releasing system permease protein
VAIGIVGTVLGIALGKTFLFFRDDLVKAVTHFTGSEAILSQFYQFRSMPAHTDTSDLVIIAVAAIVLSTLAGLIPAILAAKLKPAEALRSE